MNQIWRRGLLVLILLCALLLNGGFAQPVRAQGRVTPNQIEMALQPGQCEKETIAITTSSAPPKLDLAFVIDVTESMEDEIDEVKRSASTIMADTRSLVADTAFALGTFSDYGNREGDYPWRVDQDISKDEAGLQAVINNIELKDGRDKPEPYLRALYETQFLSWREGSRRLVILFGDNLPHNPDPGADETPETSDDLTQDEVLVELAAHDISIIALYTNPFEDEITSFYESVADETGGEAFFLERSEDIPQVVRQLVEETVNNIKILTLDATSPGNAWLEWTPDIQSEVAPEETRNFALELCVPEETTVGDYSFDLDIKGDGAVIGQIPVRVDVVGADLSVGQNASSNAVLVEDELTYTLTVSNNGTLPATDVTLTDELAPNTQLLSVTSTQGNCRDSAISVTCDLFSLASGTNATITLVVKPTEAKTLTNSVTVMANEHDPDQSNNSASGKTTVNPVSEIAISQAGPNEVTAGDMLTYTLTIANNGPSPASAVVVSDKLPTEEISFHSASASQGTCRPQGGTVTCDLGKMAQNTKAEIDVVIVPDALGTITNQASVTANEFDPNPSNNNTNRSTIVNRNWLRLFPFLLIPLAGLLLAQFFRGRRRAKKTSTASSAAPLPAGTRRASKPTRRGVKGPQPDLQENKMTHGRSNKPRKRS